MNQEKNELAKIIVVVILAAISVSALLFMFVLWIKITIEEILKKIK